MSAWDNGFTYPYFLPFMNGADWALILLPLFLLIFLKFTKALVAEYILYYGAMTAIIMTLSFSLLVLGLQLIPLSSVMKITFYSNPIHRLQTLDQSIQSIAFALG